MPAAGRMVADRRG